MLIAFQWPIEVQKHGKNFMDFRACVLGGEKVLQMCCVWAELTEISCFADTQPETLKFTWIVYCSLYFFNGILLSEYLEDL